MSRKKTRLRLLFALSPLAFLAVAELVAREIHPPPRAFRIWPPGLERRFEPDPLILAGVTGPSIFRINSVGLRGDEPPPAAAASEVYRIVAVGGSATECLYLDQGETWPALLQVELSATGRATWVGNAGRSGHTTRHHRLQIDQLLELEPRPHAIVLLAGVNDLTRRLAADASYDPLAFDRPELRARLLVEAFAVAPDGPSSPLPFYEQTGLWRAARSLRDAWLGSPREQDPAGAIYARRRALRAGAGALRPELPDLSSALQEFRRNLEACHAACREAGVRLVLSTQPCLWRADLPPELARTCWMGGVGNYAEVAGCDYYTLGALALGLRRYNETLLDCAAESSIEVLDLSALLPPDASAFYDDVHMNEHGARLAAAAFARHFRERPPGGHGPDGAGR